PGLVNRLVQIEKSRGVGGIEWIMSRRFLIRSVQSDVDATVLGQNNHVQVAQNFTPLFVGQVRIGINEILDLVLAELMLFAHCLRINVRLGNTLFNEESFGASNTTLGQFLIEFRSATRIRVTGQGYTPIRLDLQVHLEVSCERGESCLLTFHQAALRMLFRRLSGWEVHAV